MGLWTPKGEREVASDGNIPPNRAERRAMMNALKIKRRACTKARDKAASERGIGTPALPIREAMRRVGHLIALDPWDHKSNRHALLDPVERTERGNR